MKGKFIVIYGINNIGKTTHAKLLVSRLKKLGKKAVYVKYPVYSIKPSGRILNQILRSGKPQRMPEEELQLWYVLNRYQFQPTLLKWLKQGKIVVAEDYVGTGIAWGAAKGANLKELEKMNKYLVKEDLGILLEGKRKLAAKERGHLHEEQEKWIKECQKIFQKLQKKYGWKTARVALKIEDTYKRIWRIVKDKIF